MSCAEQDFVIVQGKTFQRVVRWESLPYVYKAVTAATATAPLQVTSTAHGVPDGWRCALVSLGGMVEANAKNSPPKEKEFRKATKIDANTLAFNGVNAAGFSAYTSGGYVQYYTPVDLAGYTARMTVKDSVGGAQLVSLTTENGKIALNNTDKTITLTISATETAALAPGAGVYELEMVSPTAVVTAILRGAVEIVAEVTT